MMGRMAKRDEGGHGVGVSKVRQFRCSDDLWEAAQRKASAEGETVSDVLRQLLVAYVGDRGIKTMDTQ